MFARGRGSGPCAMVHAPRELRHVENPRWPVPGRIKTLCRDPTQILLAIRRHVRCRHIERDRSVAIEQNGGGNGRIRRQVVGQAADKIPLGEGFEQMTLSAVTGLMQRWTENDVFAALRGQPTQGQAQ